MALCWANLDKLSASDQLAFRLLAASGMRLGEVFEIGTVIEKVIKRKGQPDKTIRYVNGTEVEKGVRYCVAGTKTKNSTRRVPFPASVLPYLPGQITGPVLEGDSDGTSSRLNAWLRDIGIDDSAKVVYSLRHRAKDQLRAEECDEKIAEAIFGRDKVTMGDKYGVGYPMTVVKKWIDKIDPHQPGLRAVA
jgi:integrase